jgi:hypothetical protein
LLHGHESQFFSLVAPKSETFAPNSTVTSRWRNLISGDADLASLWDVNAPHAQFLYWFLELWCVRGQSHLPVGTRVRFIVDQQDWLSNRRNSPVDSKQGLAHLAAASDCPIEVEVLCIVDKSTPAVAPFMPLLGLVDSEVWLYGRLLSRKAADGRTVHEHYAEHGISAEPLAAGHVTAVETLGDVFARDHADHKELWEYLAEVFPHHISVLPDDEAQ